MSVVDGRDLQRPAALVRGAAANPETFVSDAPRLQDTHLPAQDDAPFHVEWRPLAALGDIASAWRDLAQRCLEPNVFYAPDFALAAAPVFGAGVGVVLVWSERTSPRRLMGFFPLRRSRRRYGLFPQVLVGWTHPYGPLGVPLVDADDAENVTAAAFDFLSSARDLPHLLLLPLTPSGGRWADLLRAVTARRGGRIAAFGEHRRALLSPGQDRAGYLDRSIAPRKRRELRRQAKRLAEQGDVSVSCTTTPDAVGPALETYLALEAGGWKGRTGSAAAAHADVGAFVRRAIHDLALSDGVQIVQLALAGRPIASGIVLRSGDRAWFWKIAYDENEARASPGVQLTVELTQLLLGDTTLAQVDSCATADHPMIDSIWRERLDLADYLVQIDGGRGMHFMLACRLEAMRRAAIGAAKRLRAALRHVPR